MTSTMTPPQLVNQIRRVYRKLPDAERQAVRQRFPSLWDDLNVFKPMNTEDQPRLLALLETLMDAEIQYLEARYGPQNTWADRHDR